MAVNLDAIRQAAQRVAGSHGLDVVDAELVGNGKSRTLTVYLEKNAEGRARMKAELTAQIAAAQQEGSDESEGRDESERAEPVGLPERLIEGHLPVEHLSFVTHEDCAMFSRDFGVLLDVEDLIPGAEYTLEASSPGLDRKLSGAEDYLRFAGSLVKIQTFEAIAGNRHWQGRLISGDGKAGAITLDLSAVEQNSKSRKSGVKTVEIALENIEKARLIAEI